MQETWKETVTYQWQLPLGFDLIICIDKGHNFIPKGHNFIHDISHNVKGHNFKHIAPNVIGQGWANSVPRSHASACHEYN